MIVPYETLPCGSRYATTPSFVKLFSRCREARRNGARWASKRVRGTGRALACAIARAAQLTSYELANASCDLTTRRIEVAVDTLHEQPRAIRQQHREPCRVPHASTR